MKNATFQNCCSNRISYILMTKNRADKLREALSSCREYKRSDDELIVIDGASTDKTDNVVKEFSDIIDIYISEPDINGPEALNKGFLLSRGKYIKPLQDDDTFYKEALEQAYQVMESNPEVDLLVCGGVREVDGRTVNVYIRPGNKFGVSVDDYFQNRKQYPLSGCGLFFRRNLLNTVGLFEADRPFPDLGFILRSIYMKNNVRFCRINMFYHKIRDDSITRINLNRYNAECTELLNRYCSENFKREYFRKKRFSYQLASRLYSLLILSFYKLLTKSHDLIEEQTKEPQWDGGFS